MGQREETKPKCLEARSYKTQGESVARNAFPAHNVDNDEYFSGLHKRHHNVDKVYAYTL